MTFNNDVHIGEKGGWSKFVKKYADEGGGGAVVPKTPKIYVFESPQWSGFKGPKRDLR